MTRSDRPTVSAIIPFYGGDRYLLEAVASVIAQTRPPQELIVVDDGSPVGDRLDDVAALDAPFPIKVIRIPNGGQSAARNAGAEIASGELLAFLDQDDRWHRSHLDALTKPFGEDDVDWVHSDFDEIDELGRTVTQSFLREHGIVHPKRTLAACVAADLMVLPSASVIRHRTYQRLGGFDEQLRGYEDDDLYVRCFRSGARIVYRDRSLTAFRVHGTSSSAHTTFAASRLRYSDKLRAEIVDDRRLSRYYVRDLIAPRFFQVSLDDYVRAVSEEDWTAAAEARDALRHFDELRGATAWSRGKLALIDDPARFRRLLRVHQAIPPPLRVSRNAVLRLR